MKEAWAEKYLNKQTDKCWFCGNDGCDEFDSEFDTFLHTACLEKELGGEDPSPEAQVMRYLLD